MFRAWYVPLYRYGVIHGDPHLGNYQVRPDGAVNLLDFGAIRVFAPQFIRGVIDLFEAVRDEDVDKAHHAYASWGFTDISAREDGGVEPLGASSSTSRCWTTACGASSETNDPNSAAPSPSACTRACGAPAG